ncbi:MAG TPA: cytochrome C oxidase subunit IV family protein [Elusimicrobiota bacterium]|nr:cytochrome C oxidase subunit IV family protein [Elusimicrobiota bacterium]
MTAETPHAAAGHGGHAAPNVKLYMLIFGALAFLTLLTVLISYIHLPPGPAIAAAISIAVIKSSLVVLFFMHLINERPIIYGILAVVAFFVLFLYLGPMADTIATSGRRPAQSVPTAVEAAR